MLFLRFDLSAADARIVYLRSGDPELQRLARSRPDEVDIHKIVGHYILGVPEAEVVGDQRKAAKGVAHGTHYDEQPQRGSDQLLKQGIIYTPEEFAVGQARYLGKFPAIRDGYQQSVRMLLKRDRQLTNSWGRTIRFPYERLDPSLDRRGYAWYAASEVADILNRWGFVPLDKYIKRYRLKSAINLQVHDEVVVSTCPDEAWSIAQLVSKSIQQERLYDAGPLVMPVTIAIERRYHSEDIEYKVLPSKERFEKDFKDLWQTRIR